MAYHYLWPEIAMLHLSTSWVVHLIVTWLIGALALWIVSRIIPAIQVRGFGAALVATLVIAIVNATIGPILRFLTFPLTWITLGLFSLIVNAILLKLAAMFAPGFRIKGFLPAILGSIVLTILNWLLRRVVFF